MSSQAASNLAVGGCACQKARSNDLSNSSNRPVRSMNSVRMAELYHGMSAMGW